MVAQIQPHKSLNTSNLVCPKTRLALTEMSLLEAERSICDGRELVARTGRPTALGRTPRVLVREDGACAYPIVGDIPVLLGPEMLVPPGAPHPCQPDDDVYQEAYQELHFYSELAQRNEQNVEQSRQYGNLVGLLAMDEESRKRLPFPREATLDSPYEPNSLWDAYSHLTPAQGKTVLQVGGSGSHAMKFLLSGAREAWLVSPMIAELRFAVRLAERCGVSSRFKVVAAVGEELPFGDSSFDAVLTSGCLHHMITEVVLPGFHRVLIPGGRFAAVEPWRAPFYGIGTKILGKREREVQCRPLTKQRCETLFATFTHAEIRHHGALTRYPLIALGKLGVSISLNAAWRITIADDAICSLIPPLRRMGSSVALLGMRPPEHTTRPSQSFVQIASISRGDA